MRPIREHLTFANVVACLALFIALGGASYAAVNLRANSVGTAQIKKNAVRTGKIAFEAVRAGKLSEDAVPTNRLRDTAVSTSKLADDAVSQGKLQADSVGASQLKGLIVREGSVVIADGGTGSVHVDCQSGEQVVGAGTFWGVNGADRYTNYVRIVGNGATARGSQFTGTNQTFVVNAYCLSG